MAFTPAIALPTNPAASIFQCIRGIGSIEQYPAEHLRTYIAMRFQFSRSTIAILLLASEGIGAQTAPNVTAPNVPQPLVLAVKKAVATNPEVQAKLHAFHAAQGLRDMARGGYLPQVNLSASVGPETRSSPTLPSTTYDTNSLQLTLDQILFDGFYTSSEVHRLTAARRTRFYELQEAAEMVALDAVKAIPMSPNSGSWLIWLRKIMWSTNSRLC